MRHVLRPFFVRLRISEMKGCARRCGITFTVGSDTPEPICPGRSYEICSVQGEIAEPGILRHLPRENVR